ncbi:MAG: U32 family peptidase, partial [Candidatus Eremiobacteraeota bacterium]|nr:U32 family peptidase [Candidatus Eremiobacteraeota bacterium]
MRIMAPVSSPKEVDALMEAGARELYCGVLSSRWSKDYTNIAPPNRREWTVSNLKDLHELQDVITLTHSWKGKVNFVLNALYTRNQYPQLCEFLEEIRPLKPDAIIIADIGLMLMIRQMRWDVDIHASTGCTVFNLEAAKFFHR